MAGNQPDVSDVRKVLNDSFDQLEEGKEEEKKQIREKIIKIMKKYIVENESLKNKIRDILEEESMGALHVIFHLIIEIFFSNGYRRWIATGVSSVLIFVSSFILEKKKTQNWTISFLKSIPWPVSTWTRSGIGYGFKCAIDHYKKTCEKIVFKILHGVGIAISPFLTTICISLLDHAYIKHKKE